MQTVLNKSTCYTSVAQPIGAAGSRGFRRAALPVTNVRSRRSALRVSAQQDDKQVCLIPVKLGQGTSLDSPCWMFVSNDVKVHDPYT